MKVKANIYNAPDIKINGCWVRGYTLADGTYAHTRSGVLWSAIESRAKESGAQQNRRQSYVGCMNLFSDFISFAEWCQSQVGYMRKDSTGKFWAIDKDILSNNNNAYCKEFCVFVPVELNNILLNSKKTRGTYPVGVTYDKARDKFAAQLKRGIGGLKSIRKRFDTVEEAFDFYKREKELYVKAVAEMYKDVIDNRVYEALVRYEVSVYD